MESTELRLGNLFIEENSKEIIEVIGLEKNRVVFSGIFLDKWQAIPIPLTEEWLIKFGFNKKLGNYELENFRFHINKPFNYNGFLFCEGYSVLTDKIKHVHQLQNLYFSLTNEHLTIK